MCKGWGIRIHLLINAAFIAACFLPSAAYSQTYRVYRPIPRQIHNHTPKEIPVLSSLSLSAWSGISNRQLLDGREDVLSDYMVGYRLRGMYEIREGLCVGVELAEYEAKDQRSAFLKEIKQEEIGAVVQWILTPETEPRLYMLFSVGMLENKARFDFALKDLQQRTEYVAVSLGGTYRLNQMLRLGAEYRAKYAVSLWKNFAFEEKSHLRQELFIGIYLGFDKF